MLWCQVQVKLEPSTASAEQVTSLCPELPIMLSPTGSRLGVPMGSPLAVAPVKGQCRGRRQGQRGEENGPSS